MENNKVKVFGQLTNEQISKKFNNQFELVLYAIKLAETMIKSDREPRVKSDTQNRALLILQEILTGKDIYDEVDVSSITTIYGDVAKKVNK